MVEPVDAGAHVTAEERRHDACVEDIRHTGGVAQASRTPSAPSSGCEAARANSIGRRLAAEQREQDQQLAPTRRLG